MKRIKKYTKVFLLGLNLCFVFNAIVPSLLCAHSALGVPEVHLLQASQEGQQISVADFNLRDIILSCVDDLVAENLAHQLPTELLTCYARIVDGDETVSLADVVAALPTLLAYHSQRAGEATERGQRPDTISVNSPEAIVGANNCQVTKLLSLLAFIRSKIGTVLDSSCCDSVLGILGDACTILGPDSSISGTLKDLVQDFYNTWTILANLDVTATVDFSDTWTILAELQQTLTTCCAQTQQNFADTWTILGNLSVTATVDFADTWTILAGIQQTLTSCCAQIQQDFADTFTILAAITISATVDLTPVFTLLTDIKDTVSADFMQTWTMLAALQQTLTTCCAQTQQDFAGTWTILAPFESFNTFTILNDIKVTVSTDVNQTWTILAALNTTLTTCCAQTQQDFANTWTILATLGSFNEFTSLNDIKVTVSTDFNQTWTILAALNTTVTSCCAQTQTDFANTWTILAALNTTVTQDFANTWTILAALTSACAPIVITAPTTISSSGNYCLANDIIGTIIINSNNVTLNLNSHQISGAAIGVQVNAGFSAIQVENGTLAATSTGILVSSGASIINLQNLAIKNATLCGVAIDGIAASPVSSLQITNANVSNCGAGIDLINAVGASVTQCELRFNTTGLIVDAGSSSIVVDTVQTVSCVSEGILLNPNVAEIVIQNSFSASNGGHGFIATGTAFNLLFRKCQAENNGLSGFAFSPINVTGSNFISGGISNVLIDTCFSSSNGTQLKNTDNNGFSVAGSLSTGNYNVNNLTFVNCTSLNQGNGYSIVQSGFSGDVVYFVGCVSQGNSNTGFYLDTTNQSMSCVNCASSNDALYGFQTFAAISTYLGSLYFDGCCAENTATGFEPNANFYGYVILKNCAALNCQYSGFNYTTQGILVLSNNVAQNCFTGFNIHASSVIQDCSASNCANAGFAIETNFVEGTVSQCIAQGCGIGFYIYGFAVPSPWLMKSNEAIGNTTGFDNAVTEVIFVNNSATGNTTNYVGVTERAPVSVILSPTALSYWDNISA